MSSYEKPPIDIFKVADALEKINSGIADAEDRALIARWLEASPENRAIYQSLFDRELQRRGIALQESIDTHQALIKLRRHATMQQRRAVLIRVAAAVAFAAAVFYIGSRMLRRQPLPLASKVAPVTISPAKDRAILKSNGQELLFEGGMDSSFVENGVLIRKNHGSLNYQDASTNAVLAMQEVFVPPGGKFKVVLPDTSIVWLNAGSHLIFPNIFKGDYRKVELVGEAYFIVHGDAKKPFIVAAGGQNIRVLGTEFNIKGYPDEKEIRTTLVTGAVRVDAGPHTVNLKPGEESIGEARIIRVQTADVVATTGWKENKFIFRKMKVSAVLAEIARWYDVEIVYDRNYKDQSSIYNGEIGRQIGIKELLDMLEYTHVGHFVIIGRTVKVSPINL